MHVALRERNIDIGGTQVFHYLLVQPEAERAQIGFVRPRPKRDFDGAVGQVGNICYCLLQVYGEDRNRTGTIVTNRRILSPVRLPVPPPRPPQANDGIRTRDPHLGKVMFYH